MAEFYADISAPGNEYQAYADAMTWGALSTDKPLPQDGNGKAGPGHSAAVSIAEIQITALPADSNTLTIAGAVVTAKTTAAAKNQWTLGGSVATCVTNLVALLNTFGTSTAQCDAAVSTTACKLALAVPYWCRARVKPGTTDTLQIATRVAGANLNHAVNSAVAIASSGWATPPTITQFAGGADGPFAYLVNLATVFGKTANTAASGGPTYGIFFNAAPGPDEPGSGDVVHVRTRRSGSNLSFLWSSTGTPSATWRARNYLVDDGMIWSGDNGTLTCGFRSTSASGSITGSFALPASDQLTICARSKYGFEITVAMTQAPNATWQPFNNSGGGGRLALKHVKLTEAADNTKAIKFVSALGGFTSITADVCDCLVTFLGTAKTLMANEGGTLVVRGVFNGTVVEVSAATVAIGKFITLTNSTATGFVEWVGGEVRDSLGVYRCANPFDVTASAIVDLLLDSVVGVTDPSIGWTASATNRSRLRWMSAEGPNKGFRTETPAYVTDWRGDGTFPYAGAAADLRGVSWSHRITWSATPQQFGSVTPLKLSRFYRSVAAIKTVEMELYVPNTVTIYQDEIEATVCYVDSSDVWRMESVGGVRAQQLASSRSALASSSVTWTANGVASYSAKKLGITTTQPIKQGSEVTVRLSLAASRGSTIVIYVSPELTVT